MSRALLVLALLMWLGFARSARADGRHGAVVVAKTDAALSAAKGLARAAYREPSLRPAVDEATVRVILGEPLAQGAPEKLAEFARVRRAALDSSDAAVATRLLASLGRDLGVELIVMVELGAEGRAPTAVVLGVSEGRYLPMVLSPTAVPPAADAPKSAEPAFDWADVVPVLRGLAARPTEPATAPAVAARPIEAVAKPAQTRGKPPAGANNKTLAAKPGAKDTGRPKPNLLTSPWFWGGLAAVVTVGVTVLVLSQTALNQPTKIVLEGRVSP